MSWKRAPGRRDAVHRSHWQIPRLIDHGQHGPAVATMTGCCEGWIRTIVHRSNADRPAGVGGRRHASPGARPLLRPERKAR